MEYGVCGGGVGVSCRGVDVTMSLEMESLMSSIVYMYASHFSVLRMHTYIAT